MEDVAYNPQFIAHTSFALFKKLIVKCSFLFNLILPTFVTDRFVFLLAINFSFFSNNFCHFISCSFINFFLFFDHIFLFLYFSKVSLKLFKSILINLIKSLIK